MGRGAEVGVLGLDRVGRRKRKETHLERRQLKERLELEPIPRRIVSQYALYRVHERRTLLRRRLGALRWLRKGVRSKEGKFRGRTDHACEFTEYQDQLYNTTAERSASSRHEIKKEYARQVL